MPQPDSGSKHENTEPLMFQGFSDTFSEGCYFFLVNSEQQRCSALKFYSQETDRDAEIRKKEKYTAHFCKVVLFFALLMFVSRDGLSASPLLTSHQGCERLRSLSSFLSFFITSLL